MTNSRQIRFDTLESAHEYVSQLREAVDAEYASILEDTAIAQQTTGEERRVDALRLVQHKLAGLRRNLLSSLVLLNDLRTLRRLLLGERNEEGGSPEERDT
jgi:hypothetical protein